MPKDEQNDRSKIAHMSYGKMMDYMRIMSMDSDFKATELAGKVRELLAQGLTQSAVADLLHIEFATVYRITKEV